MTTQDWVALYIIVAFAYMVYGGLSVTRGSYYERLSFDGVAWIVFLVRVLLWPLYAAFLFGLALGWIIEAIEDLRMGWRMSRDD